MGECVTTVPAVIPVVENYWPFIRDWFMYHKVLAKKLKSLDDAMKILTSQEEYVRNVIEQAEEHGFEKKRSPMADQWLDDVKKKKGDVEGIKKDAQKRRRLCRLNFLNRLDQVIKDVTCTADRDKIIPEDRLLISVQHAAPLVATDLVGAEKHLEEIRTFLKDDKITRIGVWGMGGVGKTAIVTHIHNWLQENPSCADRVYWVTVSQDSSIQKLQNDIAKCINLDLSKEDDQKKRAAMLSNALKQRKKFVIILDDMWIEFSLEEIGIPIEEGQMISGKLLITCRSLEVCHKMKCQKQIKVEPLPPKEAWDLFMKEVGWEPDSDQKKVKVGDNTEEIDPKIVKVGDNTVEIDPKIVRDAHLIAEECAGLPLAISTTAKSMSAGYGFPYWENALHELRESISESIDMEGRVFKVLKSSYDRLNNETFKKCFLYCAFFPEDYNIPKVELIVHWIAEGLLDDRITWKQKYDWGHSILKRLENVCLLESGQDNNNCIGVKMHDVIRDMALNIAKEKDQGVFKVKSGPRLSNQNTDELTWSQHLKRVCLHKDVVKDHLSCTITTSPQCPDLVTLMLQFDQNVPEIPDHFFAQMGSLRVLDLSYMILLKRLPNSISSLRTLRGLLLDSCLKLEYVPSLAELKELRVLILSRSVVAEVPVGLEGLVKLECLDLSASSRITEIPLNLICKLSRLQCLRLDYVKAEIPVDQLSSSSQLEMLSMHFYDLQKFNNYVKTRHPEGLCQYHLQIRSRPQSKNLSIGYSLERKQVSVISSRIEKGDLGIVFPTNMQELSIFECKLPNSLLDFSPSLNNIAFKHLERCQIGNSTGINYLWSFTKTTISVPTQLQILKLDNLEELTRLFNYESEGVKLGSAQAFPSPSPSPSPAVTSSALKLLIVSKCPKLEYLFTAWLVRRYFQNLQLIRVRDCSGMLYIIKDDEKDEDFALPKLQYLELINMPKLETICRLKPLVSPLLQQIEEKECPVLNKMSLPPTLNKETRGQKEWWGWMEDDIPEAKSTSQP